MSEELTGSVVSRDGTVIAFDRYGSGAPVVLVGGAFTDRKALAPPARALAADYTVFAYDRRGRGGSGDVAPYAVEREVEDLAAVIAEAGQPAFVYGHSSGAALVMHAAAAGVPIAKLALYEPPYVVDGSRPNDPSAAAARINELVSAGRRGDAVEYWMLSVLQMPEPMVAQMRKAPMWPGLESAVHTTPYELAIMAEGVSDNVLPPQWAQTITAPTLVMVGGRSAPWQHHTVEAVAKLLPNAESQTFSDADHGVAPDVLSAALREFFGS